MEEEGEERKVFHKGDRGGVRERSRNAKMTTWRKEEEEEEEEEEGEEEKEEKVEEWQKVVHNLTGKEILHSIRPFSCRKFTI